MFKQSDLVFTENTKRNVSAEFCSNDFYWEERTGELQVYDSLSNQKVRTIYLDKDTAVCARKTIVDFINRKI